MSNAGPADVDRGGGTSPAGSVGISVLALVGGAVLLIALFVAYYLGEGRWGTALDTVTFTHEQLGVLFGEAHREADAIVVPATSSRVTVLVSSPTVALPALVYNELEWRIDGLTDSGQVRLVWATQEVPGKLQGAELSHQGRSVGRLAMHDVSEWGGTIQGVGVLVTGPLEQSLEIRDLTLEPKGLGAIALLSQLWREWTVFEGWHGWSAHFIVGGTRGGLFSPVPAVAAWVALSSILYTGVALWRRRYLGLLPYAFFLLSGWLALDLRWQVDLWRQVALTEHTFAGKTWDEKRLAAPDGETYRFVRGLKSELPAAPARIFVVSADPAGTGPGNTEYLRLRVQYHLLPHNVYSDADKPPSASHAEAGDFILILGSMPDISFDSQDNRMRWDGAAPLPVERVYQAPMGTLYRVM